jgi:hypothetical protein
MQPANREDLHEFVLLNSREEKEIRDSKTDDREEKLTGEKYTCLY